MAAILHSVASGLVGSLAPLAIDELKFLRGVPGEMQRLRERLERILPVLDNPDACRPHIAAFDAFVKQLRDVVYDAVDVVEEHMLEKEKKKKKTSLLSSLTFTGALGIRRHKLGNKIGGINQRIDDIVKDIPILPNLIPSGPSDRTDAERGISRRTSPSVFEPDLVGERMEEDATMLVNMLVSKDGDRNRSKISVFATVGMGGIGKTTLAQKIINDERLKADFHTVKPIWVCVSQDFSEIDLLRAIVRGFGVDPGEVKDKSVLEPMVGEIVKGKRFFLVLDDVWDARVWEELLHRPLQGCSAGARVLVTTRFRTVARRMKAVHCHQVEKLSDEDGWLLTRKMVLPDNEDAVDFSENLRGVGMRIVKKCDGLPLALKAIAGVLRSKEPTRWHWEEVLHSLSWSLTEHPEGASGVLYLSYAELPSPLKKCFLYFALFPEDYEYERHNLINLWIAEGFVETKGDMLMEELAWGYWDELVHRSLLQPLSARHDSLVCKMHDLLHDLARSLASEECLCLDMHELNNKSTSASSSSMRRLYMKDGVKAVSDVITEHAPPRTLLVPFVVEFTKRDVTRLGCLRILDVRGSSIENLPDSIGDLTHLRYLNLSYTAISKLPESIGELANLQFLILERCSNLHHLPKSVVNLRNLRCLDLDGTELHSMPIGISKLSNLVALWGFLVCNNKKGNGEAEQGHCSLEELGPLSQLLALHIHRLESTSSREAARAAALKEKPHLSRLELHCTARNSEVEVEKIGQVFEELHPPPCMELFEIKGYFGREYPSWMMNSLPSSFPNLRRLVLDDCVLIEQLPPLGLLPQLDFLQIGGASAVKIIGPELFGVGSYMYPHRSFPKLRYLLFEDMPSWKEWGWLREEENGDQIRVLLPCLERLVLKGCPSLRSLPESLLRRAPALTNLYIEDAHGLTRVENLHQVQVLGLHFNPRLERVSNLPALKELDIWRLVGDYGEELKVDVESVNSLQLVSLFDAKMGSLPRWIEEARHLRTLRIVGNTKLLSRCLVGGQDWHKIERIARFDAYHVEGDGYYIHYTRSPFSFDANVPSDDVGDSSGWKRQQAVNFYPWVTNNSWAPSI